MSKENVKIIANFTIKVLKNKTKIVIDMVLVPLVHFNQKWNEHLTFDIFFFIVDEPIANKTYIVKCRNSW